MAAMKKELNRPVIQAIFALVLISLIRIAASVMPVVPQVTIESINCLENRDLKSIQNE
jgi:hypothetical protein